MWRRARSIGDGVTLDFAARGAFQRDLVRAVEHAIADRVGDGWVGDGVVPALVFELLVMTVARRPYRSSRISKRSRRLSSVSSEMAKSLSTRTSVLARRVSRRWYVPSARASRSLSIQSSSRSSVCGAEYR